MMDIICMSRNIYIYYYHLHVSLYGVVVKCPESKSCDLFEVAGSILDLHYLFSNTYLYCNLAACLMVLWIHHHTLSFTYN